MMRMGSALAVAAAMGSTVSAYNNSKEQFVVTEDTRHVDSAHPRTTATSNQYCAVNQDDLKVCFDFGVGLKIGWEFVQTVFEDTSQPEPLDGTSYYDFTLRFYTEQEVDLEFNFFMQRLVELWLSGELTQSKLELDLSSIFHYVSKRNCWYATINFESFYVKFLWEMALVQFYKNIIESLWTIDNWASKWALFFDELEMSQTEVIEIWEYNVNINSLSALNPLYGTDADTGTTLDFSIINSCFPLWWGGPDPNAAGADYAARIY